VHCGDSLKYCPAPPPNPKLTRPDAMRCTRTAGDLEAAEATLHAMHIQQLQPDQVRRPGFRRWLLLHDSSLVRRADEARGSQDAPTHQPRGSASRRPSRDSEACEAPSAVAPPRRPLPRTNAEQSGRLERTHAYANGAIDDRADKGNPRINQSLFHSFSRRSRTRSWCAPWWRLDSTGARSRCVSTLLRSVLTPTQHLHNLHADDAEGGGGGGGPTLSMLGMINRGSPDSGVC
jgi:hypothetical protein